jgi:hypothetical protein
MSSSSLPYHGANVNPRNSQTTLKYWPRPSSSEVTIDFRKPGAEERFNELVSLEEEHAVTIRDIRGLEANEQPTLERNGFEYIYDPLPGYDERESWNERRVERFFLPRAEELIAELYP